MDMIGVIISQYLFEGCIVDMDFLKEKCPDMSESGLAYAYGGELYRSVRMSPESFKIAQEWSLRMSENPDPMDQEGRKRYVFDESSPSESALKELSMWFLPQSSLDYKLDGNVLEFDGYEDARAYDGTMSMAISIRVMALKA